MTELFKPQSFETALEEAERSCFGFLCSSLGLIAEKNAFIALSKGVPDCMIFDIGQMQFGEMTRFRSSSYAFTSKADFYSRNRSLLQRIIMRLLYTLPFGCCDTLRPPEMASDTTNVVQFRLTGEYGCISEIEDTIVQLPNLQEVPVFHFTSTFDTVFSVGKRGLPNTNN